MTAGKAMRLAVEVRCLDRHPGPEGPIQPRIVLALAAVSPLPFIGSPPARRYAKPPAETLLILRTSGRRC
jgi:hypothetical protein